MKTTIAVDCMGGDFAPEETVKGALLSLERDDTFNLSLVGKEDRIAKELEKYEYPEERVSVINATEVIETGEPPVAAIRGKTDSSMVKSMRLVKEGAANGMVTAGSTGAALAGGQLIIGRLPGIRRPPLAPLIPTAKGASLLIDCGANVDARPAHLLQFARIGSVYMENIVGVKEPKVAIVNIGAEEEKGNALVKETFPLLKELPGINFTGNIEARDIPKGDADVIVCEAFVGNVILKMYEGVGGVLLKKITETLKKNLKTKIGALLIKPELKRTLKAFQMDQYGGAPLLGLKGLLVKTHGSAKAAEVCNSVLQCVSFNDLDVNNKIIEKLAL